MKKTLTYLILVFTVALFTSCNSKTEKPISGDVVHMPNSADGEVNPGMLPSFDFESDFHDFGKVIKGEVVTYAFKFKNSGKSDLMIADITSSCGCTATEYPDKPVKPGQEDYIKVTFNSEGRKGYQYKTVTILANTQPNKTVLNIKAEVVVPERDY
jgi:hypothetical protein